MSKTGKIKFIIVLIFIASGYFSEVNLQSKSLIVMTLFSFIAPILIVSMLMLSNKKSWPKFESIKWNQRVSFRGQITVPLSTFFFFSILLLSSSLGMTIRGLVSGSSSWGMTLLLLFCGLGFLSSAVIWSKIIKNDKKEKINKPVWNEDDELDKIINS